MSEEPSRAGAAGGLAVLDAPDDEPDGPDLLLISALFDPDEDVSWRAHAACAGSGPGLFFHERTDTGSPVRQARLVCQGCPVRADCLDYALRHREKHGVWGGTTWRQRQRMVRDAHQAANQRGAA